MCSGPFEESIYWDAYDYTVYDIVWREVKRLPPSVLRTLWLDTIPGELWLIEEEGEQPDSAPYVAEHITRIVYDMASDWSNRRIRAYLKRSEI